jgi:hypothetical protein
LGVCRSVCFSLTGHALGCKIPAVGTAGYTGPIPRRVPPFDHLVHYLHLFVYIDLAEIGVVGQAVQEVPTEAVTSRQRYDQHR